MIKALFLSLFVLLAGCATGTDDSWPSLAPRANEISPLVPRVPLGVCAGCNSSGVSAATNDGATMTAPPDALGPPVLPPLPNDLPTALAAISTGLREVEVSWPQARAKGVSAITSARTSGSDEEFSEAEVQASRFEALFLGLGVLDADLLIIEDGLAARPEMIAEAAEAAALRLRLEALEQVRVVGL